MSAHTGHIELSKLLTLKQYLHIYSEIKRHVSDAADTTTAIVSHDAVDAQTAHMLDASVIMMQYVILLYYVAAYWHHVLKLVQLSVSLDFSNMPTCMYIFITIILQ